MKNTLAEKYDILYLKSRFFIYRTLSYFSFLLLPIWIQKSLHLPLMLQGALMALYILFMIGQWFLLGKEIDHRFKIYYRVNSSLDRVVYRFLLGMFFVILYFNLLALLPYKWIYNCFWATWVVLGLFYSWPTRGKIIQESVTTNFSEFRYLDSFEKTLVFLIIFLFIMSFPELPSLTNPEALELFFDPQEKYSKFLWNFITINYFPFKKYPSIFRLALSMHFYVIGMGLFLLCLYAFIRYFLSRRLSLLGVFALITSWSFSKILASSYDTSLISTFSLIWVWSFFWVSKSSTYRSGLFLGLISFWGALIDRSYFYLLFIQAFIIFFYFLKQKNYWYKRQTLKYALFGYVLACLAYFFGQSSIEFFPGVSFPYFSEITNIIGRKAFFSLSIIGLLILMLKVRLHDRVMPNFKLNLENTKSLLLLIFVLAASSFLFETSLFSNFSLMWLLTIVSLIPLELIFQTISRLRSSRNMIYLIYILICLLDSHFEGRVKIFLRTFLDM